MRTHRSALPDVILIEPHVWRDNRGSFFESWHLDRYRRVGVDSEFVQDNVSVSKQGVLRGLHYQYPNGQGKLVSALEGEVFDVAVDVRNGSETFGRWVGFGLSGGNRRQVYIPPGFAHGFLTLSDTATFSYKCTRYYDKATEHCIVWDDPVIGIDWPDVQIVLSDKDRKGARLSSIPIEDLPPFDA